jgi:hypothetical protein
VAQHKAMAARATREMWVYMECARSSCLCARSRRTALLSSANAFNLLLGLRAILLLHSIALDCNCSAIDHTNMDLTHLSSILPFKPFS